MPNVEQEAHRLESAARHNEGRSALNELQHMPGTERLAIIKQMESDAKSLAGKVYIDKGQLVFSSPFESTSKGFGSKIAGL